MKGVTCKKFIVGIGVRVMAICVLNLPHHIISPPSIQLFTPKMVSQWLFVNSGFLCFAHGWQTRESGEMSGVGF